MSPEPARPDRRQRAAGGARRSRGLSLLAAALALACAQAAFAKSSDRNQVMEVDAGRGDCSINDSGTCVLSGGVRITQGTLDIQAAHADLRRVGGDPRSVKLTGTPVKLTQEMDSGGSMHATAARVDYDLQEETVVLTGGAVVQQPGQSSISGERIVYNMRTGQVQGGGDGGRVKIQFQPRNRSQPGAGGNN